MTTLERLKQLDEQIEKLTKILQKGEYLASGIGIDLYLGNCNEIVLGDITLGIPSFEESNILNHILTGLKNTRDYYINTLEIEQINIKTYLETQT